MAMLVEDGYQAPEQRTMHPFFRQGMDGVIERDHFAYLQKAPHQQYCSTEERKSTTLQHETSVTPAQSDTRAEEHKPAVPRLVNPQEQTAVDPNLDRRKRRKVTPAEVSNLPDPIKDEEANTGENAWLRQQEHAAAGEAETHGLMTDSAEAVNDGNHEVKSSHQREADANLEDLTQKPTAPTIKSRPESIPTSEPPSSQKTPGKMPKRPGTGLSVSPKRVKTKGATQNPSPRGRARQSRNLTFKNGRLVSSLKVSLPYKTISKEPAVFGKKIEAILNGPRTEVTANQTPTPAAVTAKVESTDSSKSLHPFFRGKPAAKTQLKSDDAGSTSTQDSISQGKVAVPKPVRPWSEIVFGGARLSRTRDCQLLSPPWPPLELHHIGVDESTTTSIAKTVSPGRSKQKREILNIPSSESILESFAHRLKRNLPSSQSLRLPKQWRTNGTALLSAVLLEDGVTEDNSHLISLQQRIRSGQSTFDRGLPAGPSDWTHEYAPKKASDVFQPESVALRRWLEQLQVHHVQSKLSASANHKRRRLKKKRAKKRADGLDDFLVSSDEESEHEAPVKNTIIICGPYGCGKTASVYATAEDLDFEVFEIHPGMRRTAKDIFDKVGDMTHNHLVQTGASASLSRASSVLSETQESTDEEPQPDPKQRSLAVFVGKKLTQHSTAADMKGIDDKKDTQKQSLILFEEVDVLFDEDKTFWSGIQSLIATSKRPIILTCNSLDTIPLEDIEVAMILTFQRPEIEQVVEFLVRVAAAEGHLLDRQALRSLYLSRGQDLRAALAELNFWCQMTIGSTLGGLDWMFHAQPDKNTDDVGPPRIVSKATFHEGMHLIPETQLDDEDLLDFAQRSLDFSIFEWEDTRMPKLDEDVRPRFEQLKQMELAADTKSCMDVIDVSVAPLLSCATSSLHPTLSRCVTRDSLTRFLLNRPKASAISTTALSAALEPITEDNRTFPPPTGRTAPSLDGLGTTVAIDVAPYIRHIVRLDQDIERQRNEIDASSQGTGRQRTTRAARAALEGGDVASTRVDRWFPKGLDFDVVLATGGQWRTSDATNADRGWLSSEWTDTTMSIHDRPVVEDKE